jgi:hypothetical protein
MFDSPLLEKLSDSSAEAVVETGEHRSFGHVVSGDESK